MIALASERDKDSVNVIKEKLEEEALKLRVLRQENGATFQAFGVQATPSYTVIGRDRKVVYRSFGLGEGGGLEAALDAAVEKK